MHIYVHAWEPGVLGSQQKYTALVSPTDMAKSFVSLDTLEAGG